MNQSAELQPPVSIECPQPKKKIGHGQRGRSGPPGNKNAVKHGLYTYKAMLNGNGLDERTSLYKALREKEQELADALGGDPSPQEKTIIAGTVKKLLYRASLDNYLMGLKSLVRKGKAHPVLTMLLQLDGQIREDLKTLGLKRVSKQVSISDLLNGDTEQPQGETRQ